MFNEKDLKNLRKNTVQRMDAHDLSAEAEGNARRYMRVNEVGPSILGRRISRETRKANGAANTAGVRADRNDKKDQQIANKKYLIKPLNLVQK